MTLIIKSVLQDSSKAIIEDTTTYTSPARDKYYSHFYAYKIPVIDAPGNETVVIVSSQGDRNAILEWEVTTPEEGWHRFQKLLYWVWEAATTFAVGDIVENSGIFYISLQANNTGQDPITETAYWEIHTPSAADSTVANVINDVLDCILYGRLKSAYAKTVAIAAEISCECSIDKKPVEIQRYERLALLLNGIAVDNHQTRYSNGEKKVIYMSKIAL